MPKRPRLSLRDLEQENKKFLAPVSEKEQSILTAAVELLSERGIVGATTAEIARRAGVTERTLFRYFPSKSDLVRRVLFPLLLRAGLARGWETFEALLRRGDPDFQSWYAAFSAQRFGELQKNPALARTVLTELLQNDELRRDVGRLWYQHVWRPMVEGLERLRASGALRQDIDPELLARAIQSLNVGYFFTRYVLAPEREWDDAREIEKMADLLAHGCSARTSRS
jgi:TetR/AcrR family transcriptional regulator